jgi:hypothetical protein
LLGDVTTAVAKARGTRSFLLLFFKKEALAFRKKIPAFAGMTDEGL